MGTTAPCASPPHSSKTKTGHASVPHHCSRTQPAPDATDTLSSKLAAGSSPGTSSPTPSRGPPPPLVRPAPGSAAKPPLQADSIWLDSRNNHPPLHWTAPKHLPKFAPAEAATSSESTSPPADSQPAQPPFDSPNLYKNRTPADPLASSAPSARWAYRLAWP